MGTGPIGVPARACRSGLAGGRGATADLDGPLVDAANDLELERDLERRERRLEVVGIGDGLATGLDDQVAGLDPGRRREAAVLHAADEDPVALGEADRPAHAASNVRRRHGDTEARTR